MGTCTEYSNCFIAIFHIFTLHIVVVIKMSSNNEIKEIILAATLKVPVATCDEWRQGWTTHVV
jgi:hypothetical protein